MIAILGGRNFLEGENGTAYAWPLGSDHGRIVGRDFGNDSVEKDPEREFNEAFWLS